MSRQTGASSASEPRAAAAAAAAALVGERCCGGGWWRCGCPGTRTKPSPWRRSGLRCAPTCQSSAISFTPSKVGTSSRCHATGRSTRHEICESRLHTTVWQCRDASHGIGQNLRRASPARCATATLYGVRWNETTGRSTTNVM
jgi:hypothetical protein